MRKGKDAGGLPVITRDTGKTVGKVEALVLDGHGTQVLGILLDEAGWFREAKVVPWSSFGVMGLDAVIIDEEASVKKATDAPEMRDALAEGYVLTGVRVTTTDGRELGRIEDFYFDAETGAVKGFELSGGKGRKFMPTPTSFQAGKDVAFVDSSAVDTIIDLKEALRAT